MTDAWLLLAWTGVLLVGIALCVGLRRAGTPMTYVRDLLHVGAGVWPLGWLSWAGSVAPCALATAGALALWSVPVLAPRWRAARGVLDAISGQDERFEGVALYALSSAGMTFVAMLWPGAAPEAAGALLALALGDGIGGAVGRLLGRHRFPVPFGKPKSWEGSLAVAACAAAGVWIALLRYSLPPDPLVVGGAGIVGALAEAFAPRATDNLAVPAAVFLWLRCWALTS